MRLSKTRTGLKPRQDTFFARGGSKPEEEHIQREAMWTILHGACSAGLIR